MKFRKPTSEEIIVGTSVFILTYVIIKQLFKRKPTKTNPMPVKNMRITNSGAKLRKYPSDIEPKFKEIASKDFEPFVQKVSELGLEPIIAIRQLYTESSFSPDVISCKKVSSAGAKGIAQFMPATWKQYGGGGNACSVPDSLNAYPKLMKNILKKYSGRLDLALAGYNWGMNRDVLEEAYKLNTPFIDLKSKIPSETYNYVASILQP